MAISWDGSAAQTMKHEGNQYITSFKLFRQSIFDLESGNQNISNERMPETSKQKDSKFESNQALGGGPITLLSVKLEIGCITMHNVHPK